MFFRLPPLVSIRFPNPMKNKHRKFPPLSGLRAWRHVMLLTLTYYRLFYMYCCLRRLAFSSQKSSEIKEASLIQELVTIWIVTVQLDKCGVLSPLDFVSRAFLYGCLAAFKLMFCTIFVCRSTATASIYTCSRTHA